MKKLLCILFFMLISFCFADYVAYDDREDLDGVLGLEMEFKDNKFFVESIEHDVLSDLEIVINGTFKYRFNREIYPKVTYEFKANELINDKYERFNPYLYKPVKVYATATSPYRWDKGRKLVFDTEFIEE